MYGVTCCQEGVTYSKRGSPAEEDDNIGWAFGVAVLGIQDRGGHCKKPGGDMEVIEINMLRVHLCQKHPIYVVYKYVFSS